jgi:hypothetical protein
LASTRPRTCELSAYRDTQKVARTLTLGHAIIVVYVSLLGQITCIAMKRGRSLIGTTALGRSGLLASRC